MNPPPLIYIAGPYRADSAWRRRANIQAAHDAGREVFALGGFPVTPHKLTEDFDGLFEDDEILDRELAALSRFDAVYAIEGWRGSSGALREVAKAEDLRLPIVYNPDQLIEFMAGWAAGTAVEIERAQQ